jgi:hypothetical protein
MKKIIMIMLAATIAFGVVASAGCFGGQDPFVAGHEDE